MNQFPNINAAKDAATEPEGAAFNEATREERAAYVPSPDASEYDGPRYEDGEPFPSCLRRWKHSRAGIFARDDLALLDGPNEANPALERAAKALTELATVAPRYPAGGEEFGRFEFSSYSETARHNRAMFRLCRVALDFLNADFLACEAEEMAHLRAQLAAFEQMRGEEVAA